MTTAHGRQLEELVRLSLLREYGPVQLAGFLGLGRWQLDRALTDGLIPGPDTRNGKWSSAVAQHAAARLTDIRAAVGTIPDLGAIRAADILTQRLGAPVTSDGVAELARRGLIPVAGHYKGFAVYDGRALEAFTDVGAATEANRAGRLRIAGEAAEYLRIRRAGHDHLIRAGLLTPAGWARRLAAAPAERGRTHPTPTAGSQRTSRGQRPRRNGGDQQHDPHARHLDMTSGGPDGPRAVPRHRTGYQPGPKASLFPAPGWPSASRSPEGEPGQWPKPPSSSPARAQNYDPGKEPQSVRDAWDRHLQNQREAEEPEAEAS